MEAARCCWISIDVRKRSLEYFDELLKFEEIREADIVAVDGVARRPVFGERLVADITNEEVQEAVEVIKAGKAPGLAGFAIEGLPEEGWSYDSRLAGESVFFVGHGTDRVTQCLHC